MKRKALCMFAALLLIMALLCVPVFAEEGGSVQMEYVYDMADIIPYDDWAQIEAAAKAATERYGCGVYVAVFDDMAEYGYHNIESFAEAVYDEWELGVGADRNCILLVLSMAERDYDLDAHGAIGNSAFTDYGKRALADVFLDNFKQNDWTGGFADYVDGCEQLLAMNEAGKPLDYTDDYDGYYEEERAPLTLEERLTRGGIPGVLVGLIVGLVSASSQKSKMKSAVAARDADDYLARSGVRMDVQSDVFTHTTVIRQRIERDNDRGGGGHGGTTVNSGGHSHSSGKF